MADRAKLLAELTGPNAATYDAAVRAGSNSALLGLLNAPHASARVARAGVPAQEVLAAVAGSLKLLPATALQRLQTILAPGLVNFTDADTVAELRDIFTGHAGALGKLQAVGQRPQTQAEQTCDGTVTPEDLAAVLPQIAHSHHARYLANEFGG